MTCDPAPARRSGPGLTLVGYRGSGKSTVGQILAGRLNRPFLDVDLEIAARAGLSIPAMFAQWGEPVFRDWEERVLADLTSRFPDAIVAAGGGAVLRQANRYRIHEFGFVIWLAANPAVLAARLTTDPQGLGARPALTSAGTLDEIHDVLATRTPLYQDLADAMIDTSDTSPDAVADLVLAHWRGSLRP
jgi:shikimate kinase